MVESFQYGCKEPSWILIIDETGTAEEVSKSNYSVVRQTNLVPTEEHIEFKLLAALRQLIQGGLSCKLIALLRDSTLLYRPGVDVWASEQLATYNAGLLGVASENTYSGWFNSCSSHFDSWQLSYGLHDVGERPVAPGLIFLSPEFANDLFVRNLLPPPSWQTWQVTTGAFLSWVAQMTGFRQISWGQQDKPRPPLFIDTASVSPRLPAPMSLSDQFWVHAPIRHVRGFTEPEIREWAAWLRHGETT